MDLGYTNSQRGVFPKGEVNRGGRGRGSDLGAVGGGHIADVAAAKSS